MDTHTAPRLVAYVPRRAVLTAMGRRRGGIPQIPRAASGIRSGCWVGAQLLWTLMQANNEVSHVRARPAPRRHVARAGLPLARLLARSRSVRYESA